MHRLACLVITALGLTIGVAVADPCLIVYPDAPCAYHYDPSEYYTVGPGHPLYDPDYDRGGFVLIDANTNEIPHDIYQAPDITGFVMDAENQGYYTTSHDFGLIVDGWCNAPTTYENILLVFDRIDPPGATPTILVDGGSPLYDAGLGYYCPIGDLVVCTPAQGNCYSDTMTCAFTWCGCTGIRIWAFADEDHDLTHDGGECFSAFSHDLTVPVEATTWSRIKAVYR